MAKGKTQLPILYKRLEDLKTKIKNTELLIELNKDLPRGVRKRVAERIGKSPEYVQVIFLGRYTPNQRMVNRIIKVTNQVLELYKKK